MSSVWARRLSVAGWFVIVLLGTTEARPRPPLCPGGRFMVYGAPVIAADTAAPHGPVTVVDGRVSIGTACPPTKCRLVRSRRGTLVRAKWKRGCTGLGGRVKLEATIRAGCDTMDGVLRAPRSLVTQPFRSRLTTCGDGIRDTATGEECDGGGCARGGECTACRCLPGPTSTVPATTTTTSTATADTTSTSVSSTTTTTLDRHSVARQWDEEILAAIRLDIPKPPVHARNLFHLSAAMWDAWAAYDATAAQYFVSERATAADVEAARAEAISYGAYRVLRERYAHSAGAATVLPSLDRRMERLGYDRDFTATDGTSPAALGNRIARAVLDYGYTDGANEGPTHTYADPAYRPVNEPLVVKLGLIEMVDPNRWQPLALDFFVTQNGIVEPAAVQTYIGSQWGDVKTFAIPCQRRAYLDPGPPPQLGGEGDTLFRERAVDLIRKSSQLDPDDGVVIDASPGAIGNNPLGTNDGTGHPVNPATGQPYAPNPVKRGDWARVLAEFWADGPDSETPPGHWNVLANEASDYLAEKRLGGTGPRMTDLEWDVKLYFALNGAVHDAAVACWGFKRKYDNARPISQIRWMARLGQSSDPSQPRYHPLGLPLIPGLIELITDETTDPGGRHAQLAGFEGEIAVFAWPGQPPIPLLQYSGAQWTLGRRWLPYQKSTFVTPAFAGYTSGHSTFSRAAAEVLTAFTGTPFVPGGLGQFVARRHAYLTFELGPTQDVALQWATYYDAADLAGLSRLYGGIHPASDDFPARSMGARIGRDAIALAEQYFAGTVAR
jgi:hypothetical protein